MPTWWFWLTGAVVGWLTGWLHFSGLAFNLCLFGEGRLAAALALQWLRIGLSVALLASLINLGLGALLGGCLGLLLARWQLIRRRGPAS